GRLFACEHAGITPDILCLGKALTGGTMTLAATLATRVVADTITAAPPGVFMHGPTFMGNPLACAVAHASLDLLQHGDWSAQVARIETGLRRGLAPCAGMRAVADVRTLGAIGVVELCEPANMRTLPAAFVARGVWVRPFGRLVYVMPPYVIDDTDLATLTAAIVDVVATL
ncbi:MAG: aminotransferase class III-fold pyridoxal phosphate-dependent enzyme, partial [Candidatus Binatia bacterium]